MTPSDYIAMSSAIIAGSALALTVWQINAARKHNKLSVKPHLIVHRDTANKTCQFILENNGLGPAVITDFKLVVAGEKIPGFCEGVYKKAIKRLDVGADYNFYHPSENEHIAPNKQVELFKLITSENDDWDRVVSVLKQNLQFEIKYTSVYQDVSYDYFGNT